MSTDWSSGVLPHEPLTEVIPGLWRACGTIANLPLKRSMIVARLPDARLVVHSAVALDEANMKQLDALGEIAVIVVPGPGHRIDANRYRARYPKATVVAPAASRKKIEDVARIDQTAEEVFAGLPGAVAHVIPGMPTELAYEFDLDGGRALVLNDVLGGGDPPVPGFGGWLFGLAGTRGNKLGLPRIVSFVQAKSRPAIAGWVAEQAGRDDLRAVTFSHAVPLTTGIRDTLKEASANV